MFSLANAIIREEYVTNTEDSSIYGWIINFSNGRKHNLAVCSTNKTSEDVNIEQRNVSNLKKKNATLY